MFFDIFEWRSYGSFVTQSQITSHTGAGGNGLPVHQQWMGVWSWGGILYSSEKKQIVSADNVSRAYKLFK